jgi:hypothetical protein
MTHVKMLTSAMALAGLTACAAANGYGTADHGGPGGDYRKVSELVELPEFIPGMGKLYVQPDTLPAGPFLAYDRDGEHVSTIYMIPLDEMNDQAKWQGLASRGRSVQAVDVAYNPGHPGVEEPHYHFTLWHVDRSDADLGK